MSNSKKNLKKILTVIIIFALIFPTVLIVSDNIPKINAEASKMTTTDVKNMDDMQIAQEISNMTGADIKEVLELKGISASWNEVLDKLKNQTPSAADNKNLRYALLTQRGLDDEFFQKLVSEGFKYDEISESKMLVERVIFQLEEITSANIEQGVLISAPINDIDKKHEEDISEFSQLLNKINAQAAVYLLLKLKKDFGTNENALDEYFLSLQIDVDLVKYVIDKDSYEEDKSEKSIGIDMNEIITLAKIELKILETLEKQKDITARNGVNEINQQKVNGSTKALNENPSLPLPEVEISNPRSPADDVMNEINQIMNRSLNNGIIVEEN